MEQTTNTLLQFRNGGLEQAERELVAAILQRREVALQTILACKHEHVGYVERVSGFTAGRICLQCGLFEEDHFGGVVFEHVSLPYRITADVAHLITVPLRGDDVGAILNDKKKLPTIIRRLVDIYC